MPTNANVVACCRSRHDLCNRDPAIGQISKSADEFFDL
jgi:hypothetical protein